MIELNNTKNIAIIIIRILNGIIKVANLIISKPNPVRFFQQIEAFKFYHNPYLSLNLNSEWVRIFLNLFLLRKLMLTKL